MKHQMFEMFAIGFATHIEVIVPISSLPCCITRILLLMCHQHYVWLNLSKNIIVSVALSNLGCTGLFFFVEPWIKMNEMMLT